MGVGGFRKWSGIGGAALDLVLPRECGGCGRIGVQWCEECAATLGDHPIRLTPRVDPGAPAWALGPYSGPRRRSVIEIKERGRRDLAEPLGDAVAEALTLLARWGELHHPTRRPLVLIPAPSRARAARSRGGDPVRRIARAAREVLPQHCVEVHSALSMTRGVRDSVGLSAAARASNVAEKIAVTRAGVGLVNRDVDVVLLDDVLTTGATAAESIRALERIAIRTNLVLVIAGV
ncbi:ComF family protein [Rhodococcus sp. NPDC056743]|uniref:ComF family protein n=1 Tax=Rhodococcus sp. NPDC056743 TaxID=3345934 RepID=UPI00366B6ECD